MSQTTKRALEASLKNLLLQKSLDKITINDIAEDCGINRMQADGYLCAEILGAFHCAFLLSAFCNASISKLFRQSYSYKAPSISGENEAQATSRPSA